jgi:5-methylthioadenosine/S-adenosylhomocysteine deaminase
MQPKVPADLLVSARWILPVQPAGSVLENQAVVIAEGRISAVGEREALLAQYAVDEIQSRPTHVLLPGFVDAATRFDSRPSINHALAEVLRAGITSFAAEDARVAELAREVASLHLRAVVGLPFAAAAGGAAQSEQLWDEYRGDPYVSFCFAPDRAALEDDAALTRLRSIADELDAPIALGARPLPRLDRLGLLRPGVILHGMTALNGEDVDLIATRSVSVVAWPEADLRRSRTHAPLDVLDQRGVAIAVGSGETAEQSFDVLAQARLAGLLNGFDAHRILHLATLGGAQALGLGEDIGSLEPGKFADLIAVDLATLATQVRRTEDVAQMLAFAATRHQVTDVWLGGRPVVHHGRLLAFDEDTLLQRSS